jgi:hypothetical protein
MAKTKMTRPKTDRPTVFFRVALLVAVSLLLTCASFGQRTPKATAAAVSTINFQARLLTAAGATVPDGNYNVEFKLYNACSVVAASGGCSTFSGNVWTETRTTTNRVRTVNGYLTVNLGSVAAFSGVNWDQDLWLTMNIGGAAGSPTWDSEMTPALKLTAVPYAFLAGGLANTNGVNRSTLGWNLQTASNTIYLPNEGGTICIQSSASCGFLTTGGAAGSYVQLQASTPGTPQTGNLNISGKAIAGTSLQSPTLNANTVDTISGTTTLNIGTTNATVGINLNQNTTIASGKTLNVQGTSVFNVDAHAAFQVRNSSGGQILVVDTIDNLVRIVNSTVMNSSLISGTGALQIGVDTSDNVALDDNEIMARSNGSTGTLYVQRLGGGLQIQATTTAIKPASDTSSTFQVQNNAGNSILGVSSSSGTSVQFGQGSTLNGKIVFNNSTNNNTVTIQSGATATSFALVLPTVLGASGDCIKDTTGSGVLGFGACGTGGGGGGATLQNSYDNSGTASPQILLSATNGGLKIRDASGGVGGNLLQLQNAAGTVTYFGLATTGLTLQDTAGNTAFIFDSSTSHLKIYADGTSPTAYADIYYDAANSEAVFTASTGTTRIGSGSGNITLQLSAAADVLQATKTFNLASAYSGTDFAFTRNVTAAGNALTGSVMKVESTSSGSSTIASNILWLNENNNSATGNLILATKAGSGNEKFKVSVDGTVTIAASQSYNGAGALQVSAGATALTLQAPGSGLPVKVGGGDINTDTTPSLLVLDHKSSSGDPSGTNGAMYYNAVDNKFRCYENGAWSNCITSMPLSVVAGSDTSNSTITPSNVTGMSFSLAANTKYHYKFVIIYQTAVSTTGIGFGVTAPTSPTASQWCVSSQGQLSLTVAGGPASYCGTGDAGSASGGVQTASTSYESVMEGYIQTSAGNSGTLQLRMKSEVAASAATVKTGSFGILTPVQ